MAKTTQAKSGLGVLAAFAARDLADAWDRLADERDREAEHPDVPLDRAAEARVRGAQLRSCANMLRAKLAECEA